MDMSRPLREMITRSSLAVLLALSSGCSMFVPAPTDPVVTTVPPPLPIPQPTIEPAPAPELPAPVVQEPVAISEPQVIKPLVAIVISDRTPAYVDVSTALDRYLDHYEIYDLSDRSMSPHAAFEEIANSGAIAVVAVGLSAAQAATKYSAVPVVVGQVFNIGVDELLSDRVKAVAVLPPMSLQLDAWLELDPTLKNVGAILGPGHEDLIADADRAMREKGIKFHFAIAQTDRETLYLFNRLVREIDGYVLFPDNRILSRSVLSEMIADASRHQVQFAVFNDSLLDHGAAFSAGAVPADIAATMHGVLEKIISGDIGNVPPVTRLTSIEIRTNPAVLRRLGLGTNESTVGNAIAGNQ
ncbi:MAG: hypothetical protein O3A13_04845 [Proteobacteria bacterium]|nr:hypothetical protein [Pseudomonadota bacterium]MDA0992940.1 hypothetical protein [Pseudomonadota bacterium]